MDHLSHLFSKVLHLDENRGGKLNELNLKGIADFIKSESCLNIIVLTGAGISTAAGIPDFRSSGSGLYDNLTEYDLPYPEAIFDISYFKKNPEPFFKLAKLIWPLELKPTIAHYFIKLLNDKNLLLRNYTQNIDTLEHLAGISADKIIEAHGTFKTSHCLTCKKEYGYEWLRSKICDEDTNSSIVPKCETCTTAPGLNGVVKPDIVFFGESLPAKFFSCVRHDFPLCDLLIIMGTSLVVQPFASLIDYVSRNTPRLLINKERPDHVFSITQFLGLSKGMDFDIHHKNARDIFWKGTCDDGCRELIKHLGWDQDLNILLTKDDLGRKKFLDTVQPSKK
ncbi:NAD-dependent protein deacetylase sirtuin-2-like [Gordionus sp. m RMFG-2023]|uniref:NAD-dependent protein deacetylase sirtuin-2-like n=1 Tax=Gordionus sp. m RMFG-2023 TaxID=3053472 RepID=UPI0031FCDE70